MKTTPARKRSDAVADRKPRVAAVPEPAVREKKRSAVQAPPADGADAPEGIRDAVFRLKRERIIAAAVDLFYGNGLGNTTLEAVAEKMGVTKPFIYSHFDSKSELLAEICSRGIRASLDVLNRVVTSSGSPTDKLHALTREFMLAVLRNQAYVAIYNREEKHLSPGDSVAIDGMRREFDRKLRELLEEGMGAGEFGVGDVRLASLAIGGMVSWSYVWWRPNGRLTQDETADRIADLVLAMVQAKPARRKRGRAATLETA